MQVPPFQSHKSLIKIAERVRKVLFESQVRDKQSVLEEPRFPMNIFEAIEQFNSNRS